MSDWVNYWTFISSAVYLQCLFTFSTFREIMGNSSCALSHDILDCDKQVILLLPNALADNSNLHFWHIPRPTAVFQLSFVFSILNFQFCLLLVYFYVIAYQYFAEYRKFNYYPFIFLFIQEFQSRRDPKTSFILPNDFIALVTTFL